MPSWIEGQIKFRGTHTNLVNFLEKGILKESFRDILGGTYHMLEPVIKVKEDYIYGLKEYLIIKNFNKAMITEHNYEILFKDDTKEDEYIFVSEIRSAWDLSKRELLDLVKDFHIDVKGHMSEFGNCTELDFEILRDGTVKSYIHANYESSAEYAWQATTPLNGG